MKRQSMSGEQQFPAAARRWPAPPRIKFILRPRPAALFVLALTSVRTCNFPEVRSSASPRISFTAFYRETIGFPCGEPSITQLRSIDLQQPGVLPPRPSDVPSPGPLCRPTFPLSIDSLARSTPNPLSSKLFFVPCFLLFTPLFLSYLISFLVFSAPFVSLHQRLYLPSVPPVSFHLDTPLPPSPTPVLPSYFPIPLSFCLRGATSPGRRVPSRPSSPRPCPILSPAPSTRSFPFVIVREQNIAYTVTSEEQRSRNLRFPSSREPRENWMRSAVGRVATGYQPLRVAACLSDGAHSAFGYCSGLGSRLETSSSAFDRLNRVARFFGEGVTSMRQRCWQLIARVWFRISCKIWRVLGNAIVFVV